MQFLQFPHMTPQHMYFIYMLTLKEKQRKHLTAEMDVQQLPAPPSPLHTQIMMGKNSCLGEQPCPPCRTNSQLC